MCICYYIPKFISDNCIAVYLVSSVTPRTLFGPPFKSARGEKVLTQAIGISNYVNKGNLFHKKKCSLQRAKGIPITTLAPIHNS